VNGAGPISAQGGASHPDRLGLAIGFRANVWNIGAEGQLIIGAIAACGRH
jgi:hypothetical protein